MVDISLITQIDLGAGTRKKQGYFGIDITEYPDIDLVMDLRDPKLPFKDNQLTDVYASHFLEHLSFEEVIRLFNEVYRVLKAGHTFEIIVPHAMSYAQFSDLSHKTAWTEDTFGHFTPENKFGYSWNVINKWEVLKNDSTPPYKYTTEGWVEVKLREVHAYLKKLV